LIFSQIEIYRSAPQVRPLCKR